MDAELLTRHLDWCRTRNLRPTTLEQRTHVLRRLQRFFADVEIEDLPEESLVAWYRDLTARVTPGARATELSHVAAYYRWLVRERIRGDDPTARLDRPRLRRRLPRPIADADLSQALAMAPERIRPWLFLAAYGGLRACEIAALRREDVIDQADPPVIIITGGKGDKQRIVPLHPEVLAVLPLDATGWLFPRRDGKPGPLMPHNVSILSNRALRAVGVTASFHALRHWFITKVYAQSLDLRLTQELAGHSDPATTAGYAAWAQERSAGVVGALRIVKTPEPPGVDAVPRLTA